MGCFNPIPSMRMVYFPIYIYHKNQLNSGKYTVHGWYGNGYLMFGGFLRVLLKVCCERI